MEDEVEIEKQASFDGAELDEFADSPLNYTPGINRTSTDLKSEFDYLESALDRYQFVVEHYDDQIKINARAVEQFHTELILDMDRHNIKPYIDHYPAKRFNDQKEVTEILKECFETVLNEPDEYLSHIKQNGLQVFLENLNKAPLSNVEKNAISYTYLDYFVDDRIIKAFEEDLERLQNNRLLENVFLDDVDEHNRDIMYDLGIFIGFLTLTMVLFTFHLRIEGIIFSGIPAWELTGIATTFTTVLFSVLIALSSD